MAQHERPAAMTDINICFAGSHSPWQRGVNENTNGSCSGSISPGGQTSLDSLKPGSMPLPGNPTPVRARTSTGSAPPNRLCQRLSTSLSIINSSHFGLETAVFRSGRFHGNRPDLQTGHRTGCASGQDQRLCCGRTSRWISHGGGSTESLAPSSGIVWPWQSGRAMWAPISRSWKAPAFAGRASIPHWRALAPSPGRKTGVADAQRLTTLARACLSRQPFIPPADIRHLRLIARQRQKLGGMPVSEKNRPHKLLADAGIRPNVPVSDIHGLAGRAIVKAPIEGEPAAGAPDLAGRLRASREQLFGALQPEEPGVAHVFVSREAMARTGRFDRALIQGMKPWRPQLDSLQTLPGIDLMGAAMPPVEIGVDVNAALAVREYRRLGPAFVRETTGARASAREGTPGSGGCFVRSLKRPPAAVARRKTNFPPRPHPQGAQKVPCGAGAQDVAYPVRDAEEQRALPGQGRWLRGIGRPALCASPDKNAGQARLRACRRRLTNP